MLPQDVCSLWNENNPLLDAGMDRSEPMNEWMNRSVYWIPKNRGWCSSKISREKKDSIVLSWFPKDKIAARVDTGIVAIEVLARVSGGSSLAITSSALDFDRCFQSNQIKSTIGRHAAIAPTCKKEEETCRHRDAMQCKKRLVDDLEKGRSIGWDSLVRFLLLARRH